MLHSAPVVKLTVELPGHELGRLVSQIVQSLINPQPAQLNIVVDHAAASATAPASPSDDDEAVPRIDNTADPPTAQTNGHASLPDLTLTPAMQRRWRLGSLCKHGHRFRGSPQSLRRRSNNGCAACNDEFVAEHTRPGQLVWTPPPPPGPRPIPRPEPVQTRPAPVVLVPVERTNGTRPTLPPHLHATCFLSPVLCEMPAHRYRGSAYTLRFLDDEDCCQCVVHTRTLKAGD